MSTSQAQSPEDDNVSNILDETSGSESDEDIRKTEQSNAVPGKVVAADIKLESMFEDELDMVTDIANRTSDSDLHQSIKKLELINTFFNGRYQDILPQIVDGRKFIIDGDSLLLFALETKGYSMDGGGQTLHIVYIVEKFLLTFLLRGLNFVVVFFEVWNKGWSNFPNFNIARNVLKLHLKHNQNKFQVLTSDSLWSKEFSNFLQEQRPGFIIMSSNIPAYMLSSAKSGEECTTAKWLQFIVVAQATYCEFLCLDVVDIDSVHSTTVCLMATIFVHFNHFKTIHKKISKMIESMEKTIPFSMSPYGVDNLPDPSLRACIHVIAIASLLEKETSEDIVTVCKTLLLSIAFMEHLPLKMRCFKNLPSLPQHTSKILSRIQEELSHVVNNVANVEGDLSQIDFRSIGDLWQGTFFVAVSNAISKAGLIKCEDLMGTVGTRYEELLLHVNNLLQTAQKMEPYPIAPICEGLSSDHAVSGPEFVPLTSKCKLIRTSCKLAELFTGELSSNVTFFSDDDNNANEKEHSSAHEVRHWHNMKQLTDEYDRIPDSNTKDPQREEKKRYAQNQRNTLARFYTIYGLSLEGRSSVKAIIPGSDKNPIQKKSNEKTKPQAKGKLSKKDKIIQDNVKRKTDEKHKQLKERFKTFSNNFSSSMFKRDFNTALEKCDIELHRAKEFSEIYMEILFLKAKACYGLWSDECHKKISVRNFHGAKELILVIREIFATAESCQLPLHAKQKVVISSWLHDLGFKELANIKSLPDPPKSPKPENFVQLNHVEFQLTHLGAELLRETGGKPDSRVEGFIPDPWQSNLFDIIDKNQSAVVVAPTSSGKTYACYYCMEKVIKSNDNDVVVYVCPTKALVNQVYATIYARFKKNLPPGKTLQGIFTRDYRQNVRDCQILTTVPECLELLLLSPRSQTWVKKIKYVIFDEVHCLLGQSGGLSWENSLMLIRCPFLALSATIHKPEAFCAWLQKMEDFKKIQSENFNLMDRPIDSYKVSLVVHSERHNHLLKNVMLGDGSIQHVHPYSFLNLMGADASAGIPKYIVLSPDEALELYNAMKAVLPSKKVEELIPLKYFGPVCPSGFLSMQAVQKFSQDLRSTLEGEDLETQSKVLAILKKVEYADLETGEEYVFRNIPRVMDALKEKNMLPAIVFTYNRSLVEALPLRLLRYLRNLDDFTEDEETESECESETETSKKGSGNKDRRRFKGKRFDRKLGLMWGPSILKSDGSLRGEGFTDEKLVEFVEHRLKREGYKSQDAFPSMLRRGVGRHHAGMNNRERSAVEMLFRLKILNVVAATGTLALGIHMPCKTVVLAGDSPFINVLEFNQMSGRAGRRGFDKEGNVVFFGLNKRKLETLMTGNLPHMIGNFPLNASLILRLLLLVSDATNDGKASENATREALARAYTLLENGLLYESQKHLKARMKYYFCFVVQLLLRMDLLNVDGFPTHDALFMTHLHYHEPGNFAFYHLLKSGTLEELCKRNKDGSISEESLLNLVIVLNFLFARLPLSKSLLKRKRVNSVVVLPPLPQIVYKALEEYNFQVLGVFSHFFKCVSVDIEQMYGTEKSLPLSDLQMQPNVLLSDEMLSGNRVSASLKYLHTHNNVCSVFAGLSGNTDQDLFPSSGELAHIRDDLNVKVVPTIELEFECNSYALDFYKHGIADALCHDNGLRAGHDFTVVKDFMLVLKTITTSLSEILDPEEILLKAMEQISATFESQFNKAYYEFTRF